MVARMLVQTLLWCALMGLVLFAAAGTWRWPGAWMFLAEMAALSLGSGLWLGRRDPALLAERMAFPVRREQPPWDRAFMLAFLIFWFGWMVLMALDGQRFGWSSPPGWLVPVGAIAFALGSLIALWVFQVNSYAVPVVKLQPERGHHVVSDGPYRFVRHPMYAGALLFFLGMPLLLGSWWGLAVAPLPIVGIAWRAVREERTLMAELAGYAEYAARVRYRLVPGVW